MAYYQASMLCVVLFHVFCCASATTYIDDRRDQCTLPDDDAARVVNCTRCGLDKMPKELAKYSNMERLYLSHNNITSIDLNIIRRLSKLAYADFSHNGYLGHTIFTGYLIESPSLKYIDLSFSGFDVILPKYLLTPELRTLVLRGSEDCDQTIKLFNKTGSKIKVLCGGVPHSRKYNDINTPPTVTTQEQSSTISQEGSNATSSVVTIEDRTSEAPTVQTMVAKSTTTAFSKAGTTPTPAVTSPDTRQTVPQNENDEPGDQPSILGSVLLYALIPVALGTGVVVWRFWKETKSMLRRVRIFLITKYNFMVWQLRNFRDYIFHIRRSSCPRISHEGSVRHETRDQERGHNAEPNEDDPLQMRA